MLETLDYTFRIGSTPTFFYFDLYFYSAYAGDYVDEITAVLQRVHRLSTNMLRVATHILFKSSKNMHDYIIRNYEAKNFGLKHDIFWYNSKANKNKLNICDANHL